jgi:hypothetical protein
MLRFGPVLALALALSAPAAGDSGAAQAPVINKPRPAPPGPSNLPPLPPAVIDDTLAIGGEDIDARKIETRIAVEVRVNGRGPYRFVVDSGADTSVVGLKIARDLQLPLGRTAVLNATTARSIVDRVKVDELTVGTTAFRDLELPALSEHHVGGQGMIGIDALVNQRLMMDFEKHAIKVEDASRPAPHIPGAIVITARRKRGQLILTEVTAAGFPLDAIIDTGTQVTIGNLKLRDQLGFKGRNRDKFWTVYATGVTGVTVQMQMARVAELKLGSIRLRDVPIAFADVPPFEVFGVANEPALLLGTDILENFRKVQLDFRSRKVRFQLRRCETQGITVSTSPTTSITRLSADRREACARS